MNKRVYILSAMLGCSLCMAQDFTVNNYAVDIDIDPKGYFDVVENYDLNFETRKHGIFRTIQTVYNLVGKSGKQEKRKIRISRIKVPDYKFEAPFDFVQELSDEITIKIGDEDVTLIGPRHYEIKYRVHNAFLFEDSIVRFYWNIKPDGWDADFSKVNFRVHLPDGITLGNEDCFVYSGVRGITTPSADFQMGFADGAVTGLSKESFISTYGESVTLLLNLPPNSIAEEKPLWPFWDEYGWLFIVGALTTAFYLVWQKYGKDDKVLSTTSYYPPEDIDPAMAGFLINDKDDASDLIALLPYWGAKGYLKIQLVSGKGWFGKKDTRIIQLKRLPLTSPAYARILFTGLFGSKAMASDKSAEVDDPDAQLSEVLISSLKNTFYSKMNSARNLLKEQAQPYYVPESRKAQGIMLVILILLGISGTAAGLFYWGPLAAVAVAITTVILILLNFYMVKRNAIGNRLLSELKGFKRFIRVAEENRLKMLLNDDPSYFENTMGYALAFGLFEKWAKKFDALNVPPPGWYKTASGDNHSMRHFSRSFSGTMSGAKSNMVSSPSSSGNSSGGGSSGGGFGGGGGGSW